MKPLQALEIIKNNTTKTSGWCDDLILNVFSQEVAIIEKSIYCFGLEIKYNLDIDYIRISPNYLRYKALLKQMVMDIDLTEGDFLLFKEVLEYYEND